MRIAQIAPLFESVPPARYGGTERVVHWLTEELVGMGHDVTLYATGDSRTSAKLVPVRAHAERFQRNFERNNARLGGIKQMLDPSPRAYYVPGVGVFASAAVAAPRTAIRATPSAASMLAA